MPTMSPVQIPLLDARRRFLDVTARVVYRRQRVVLTLDGLPVAEIIPLGDGPPPLVTADALEEETDLVRIQRAKGIGPERAERILGVYDTIAAFQDAEPAHAAARLGMDARLVAKLQERLQTALAPPSPLSCLGLRHVG